MSSQKAPTQAQPANEIELRKFLCSLHLEKYEKPLLDLGWDDLQVLLNCTEIEVRKLAQDAGLLPGHAAKLWLGLQKAKLTSNADAGKTPDEKQPDIEAETKSNDSTSSTYIGVIVDRSGSMASMGGEVVSGFNKFIEDQKKIDGTCHATITRFDNKVEILKHGVDVKHIEAANHEMFAPRGSTALFDAIGATIAAVEKKVAKMKVDRVMIMILTDGHENASKKYTHQQVMEDIERLKTKDWNFIFVGANQDAIHTGARMGIQAANCLTWTPSKQCSTETWNAMSSNLSRYRSPAKSSGFLATERVLSIEPTRIPTQPPQPPPTKINLTPSFRKFSTQLFSTC